MVDRDSFVAVVDDHADLRRAIERLLNCAGFRTCGYASAEDFLHCAPARQASCLVLDMRLPGISGLELYSKLRAEGLETPAVLLTGDPDYDGRLRTEAMAAGIGAVLEKPFDAGTLSELVQMAFRKQLS